MMSVSAWDHWRLLNLLPRQFSHALPYYGFQLFNGPILQITTLFITTLFTNFTFGRKHHKHLQLYNQCIGRSYSKPEAMANYKTNNIQLNVIPCRLLIMHTKNMANQQPKIKKKL